MTDRQASWLILASVALAVLVQLLLGGWYFLGFAVGLGTGIVLTDLTRQ